MDDDGRQTLNGGRMEKENIVVEETAVDNDVNVGEEVTEEVTIDFDSAGDNPSEEIETTSASVEEPVKTFTQEELDEIIEKRLRREREKVEKNYKPLVNTLKAGGFNSDDPFELENIIRKSYEEQGIEIPINENRLSEKEQKALAKVNAEEIIELGESVMRERFIELYSKEKRSTREEEEMFLIGRENSSRMAKKDLLELGADPDKVLNDKNFMSFASKMAPNVSVKEIYQLYKRINGEQSKTVPSAGSVKDNNNQSDKFTQSKIDNMTPQELIKFWDDPEFRKIAKL